MSHTTALLDTSLVNSVLTSSRMRHVPLTLLGVTLPQLIRGRDLKRPVQAEVVEEGMKGLTASSVPVSVRDVIVGDTRTIPADTHERGAVDHRIPRNVSSIDAHEIGDTSRYSAVSVGGGGMI